jgi:formiminotetrahydrofolate cyclodeaminase
MKQHFNEIIEVSMKIMEKSDAGFRWIEQLHKIIPQQMATHLLIACELLMGAINGTVHIVKANLRMLKSPEKRENYSKRLYHLHLEYKNRHQIIMADLGQFSEAQ